MYISTVSTKLCISSEEVKQIAEVLLKQVKQQMQENQNELKAEIQQLKNMTTGELCTVHIIESHAYVCVLIYTQKKKTVIHWELLPTLPPPASTLLSSTPTVCQDTRSSAPRMERHKLSSVYCKPLALETLMAG